LPFLFLYINDRDKPRHGVVKEDGASIVKSDQLGPGEYEAPSIG
jgi:hypothetical protein